MLASHGDARSIALTHGMGTISHSDGKTGIIDGRQDACGGRRPGAVDEEAQALNHCIFALRRHAQ